jgi:hypothetical protein
MRLQRRLEALERGLLTEPTLLTMPDGRMVRISGPGDYLLRLIGLTAASEGVTPEQTRDLELIRQCTDSTEPGEAHLVDLIRCLLLSPVEDI